MISFEDLKRKIEEGHIEDAKQFAELLAKNSVKRQQPKRTDRERLDALQSMSTHTIDTVDKNIQEALFGEFLENVLGHQVRVERTQSARFCSC